MKPLYHCAACGRLSTVAGGYVAVLGSLYCSPDFGWPPTPNGCRPDPRAEGARPLSRDNLTTKGD